MNDLVEFIEARIAEDQETARNEKAQRDRLAARAVRLYENLGVVTDASIPTHDVFCEDDTAGPGLTAGCGCANRKQLHDPAATLARCDSDEHVLRALIALANKPSQHPDVNRWAEAGIRHFATRWATHSDYRQEWKP